MEADDGWGRAVTLPIELHIHRDACPSGCISGRCLIRVLDLTFCHQAGQWTGITHIIRTDLRMMCALVVPPPVCKHTPLPHPPSPAFTPHPPTGRPPRRCPQAPSPATPSMSSSRTSMATCWWATAAAATPQTSPRRQRCCWATCAQWCLRWRCHQTTSEQRFGLLFEIWGGKTSLRRQRCCWGWCVP